MKTLKRTGVLKTGMGMYAKTLLKLGILKALINDEFSLPEKMPLYPTSVRMAAPRLSQRINPVLPLLRQLYMTSPEAVVPSKMRLLPQKPLPQHLFVSRPVTRLKSSKPLKTR